MDTELEIVKYICKDFWEEVFKKHIDVLKTNHKVRSPLFSVLSFTSFVRSSLAPQHFLRFPTPPVTFPVPFCIFALPFCQGLFVLHDHHFRWLTKVSYNDGATCTTDDCIMFPAGLICGALTRLGLQCRVVAEAPTPPKCSFTIQVVTKQGPLISSSPP